MEENKKVSRKAVVVYSGGQDSTTCLLWAKKNYDEVYAVSFDYGQRHSTELAAAEKICRELGVPREVISLPELNRLSPNSLTRKDIPVDEEKPEGTPPNSLVEGRNLLFLTYAAIFAKGRGIRDVITGVSQTDFSGYPDCRDGFIKSLNVTLNLGMDYDFRLITPLMWIDKKETWALADSLGGFDLVRSETVTCYNGIPGDGCGDCPACRLRKRGLELYLAEKKQAEK